MQPTFDVVVGEVRLVADVGVLIKIELDKCKYKCKCKVPRREETDSRPTETLCRLGTARSSHLVETHGRYSSKCFISCVSSFRELVLQL